MKRRDLLGFAAGLSALSLMSARGWTAAKLGVGESDVFVVVDVQNCFAPGGSLAVKGGDEIVPCEPARQALQARRADAGLAYARPCLVRLAASRQEAV